MNRMHNFTTMRLCTWHCIAWAFWFLLNTFPYLLDFTAYNTLFWIQVAANFLALVLVFYAVARLARIYFTIFSFARLQRLRGAAAVKYLLLQWPAAGILAVASCYVAVFVWLDGHVFGHNYPTLLSNIDQRFLREGLYILLAIGYSAFSVYSSKMEKRLKAATARVFNMKEYMLQSEERNRTAITQMKKEISALKKAGKL